MRPFQRSQAALLVCCALAPLPARAEERLLAVLEFKSKLDGAESKTVDVGYLADVVRSAALEDQPGLRVMTRENMLVLVQASGKALADCEGECEVDTGRKLGADLVVSGELLKFGTKYKLDLRLHDTKEGRLLSGAQASGKSVDELDDATGAAVKKLLAVLRPAAPVATPAPALAAPSVPAPAPAPAPANPRDGVAAASAPAPAAAPGAFSPAAVSASEAQLVQRAFAASFSNTTASLMRDKCQKDAKDCAMFAFGYANGSWDMAAAPATSTAARWPSTRSGRAPT